MEGMLRMSTVRARVNVSTRTLYRWIRRGTFPRPVQLGPGSVGWHSAEIEQWLAERPRAGGAVCAGGMALLN